MSWPELLAKPKASNRTPKGPRDGGTENIFMDIMDEIKRKEEGGDPTYAIIPRLLPKTSTEHKLLAEAARKHMRNRHASALLTHEELEYLWQLLRGYTTNNEEERLNYDTFCAIRQEMPPKCAELFEPSIFLQFQRDDKGKISAAAFFDYVSRKTGTDQLRISLAYYDPTGAGYLREADLVNYMTDQMSTIPRLAGLHKSFYPYYTTGAVRKFLFFLDTIGSGHIKIHALVTSPFMAELEEAREANVNEQSEATNWFSARTALRVYGQFVGLDQDRDGFLSPKDLMRYGKGSLTPAFIKAVFSHSSTGKMSYPEYIDFVLAMEHRSTPQALTYLFRLLDINGRGYLTVADINYFFKDIIWKLQQAHLEPVQVEDVRDEIFDMVTPKDPYHITLDDIIRCGAGDIMVGILIDMELFWLYETRESYTPPQEESQ